MPNQSHLFEPDEACSVCFSHKNRKLINQKDSRLHVRACTLRLKPPLIEFFFLNCRQLKVKLKVTGGVLILNYIHLYLTSFT